MKSPDYLYRLLPAVYQSRDAEVGRPLQALLRVIEEQVDAIEENTRQLYENWFIETCEDWVVPYLGDLIGYRPVSAAGRPQEADGRAAQALSKRLIPRRDVANTLRNHRRKGTLALLELLAFDVADWPVRAVEFSHLLAFHQHVKYARVSQGRQVDLRERSALTGLGGPFDRLAHAVDVRRISSATSPGRHNLPHVGLFVWRLRAYSVGRTTARCVEEFGPECYSFSVLGHDTPLLHRPQTEARPTQIAQEANLPTPIRRGDPPADDRPEEVPVDGPATAERSGRDWAVWVKGWPSPRDEEFVLIPSDKIVAADLRHWRYRPKSNQVAFDPERGRLAFHPRQAPAAVEVMYHYAFSADLGGGEYHLPLRQPPGAEVLQVSGDSPLTSLSAAIESLPRLWAAAPGQHAVIEITDNRVYEEPLDLRVPAGRHLLIRAGIRIRDGADGSRAGTRFRPIIRLADRHVGAADSWGISLDRGAVLTLEGLLICERGLTVQSLSDGAVGKATTHDAHTVCGPTRLVIRHSTLVPGWQLQSDCTPCQPNESSLRLINFRGELSIENSIVGSIAVASDEVATEPVPITIRDSIVDATHQAHEAIGDPGRTAAHAVLDIRRVTVFGEINIHSLSLAENTLFTGRLCVARSQNGCVRFSYVPAGSRTPRRFQCQPDEALRRLRQALAREAQEDPTLSESEIAAREQAEANRVQPSFTSVRYGTAAYAQLAPDCPFEIGRGADDRSEMGVFHDLFQPQRTANLRARLAEFIPAGMRAEVLFVT